MIPRLHQGVGIMYAMHVKCNLIIIIYSRSTVDVPM